mgnify:CR=1 FL=1
MYWKSRVERKSVFRKKQIKVNYMKRGIGVMKKEEKRTQNNHGSQEKDIDSLLRSALRPTEEPSIELKVAVMKWAFLKEVGKV